MTNDDYKTVQAVRILEAFHVRLLVVADELKRAINALRDRSAETQ